MEDTPVYTAAELKVLQTSLAGPLRELAESHGITVSYVDPRSKKVKNKNKMELVEALAGLRHCTVLRQVDAISSQPVARSSTRPASFMRRNDSPPAAAKPSLPSSAAQGFASPTISLVSVASQHAGPSTVTERHTATLREASQTDSIESWSSLDNETEATRPSAAGSSPTKSARTSPVKLGRPQPLRFFPEMDDLAQSSKLLIARLPNMGLGRDMPTNAVLRRVMVHMATIADFQDSDRHPAAEEPNLHGPPAPASRGSTPRLEPSQKSLSRSGTEVGLLGPLSEPLAGCVLLPGSDFRKSTRNSTRGSPEAEDQDDEAKEDASAADGENGNWWTSEDDGASIRSSEISCPPCAQPPQPWVPPPPSLPIDEERQRRHDVAVRTMLEPDMLEMFCAITLILERRPGFCMPRYDDVLPLLGQIWRAAAPRQTRYDVSVPYAGEPAHLSPLPEPELPSASSIASQASWDALRVPTPNSTPPRTGLSGVRRDGSNVELLMPSPPSSPRAGLSSVSRDDRSTTVRPLDEGTSVLMAPGTGDHESEGVSVMRAGDSPVEPSTRPGKRRHGSENGDGDGDEPVVGRRKKKKTAGPSPKVDKGKGRAYND